MNQIKHESESGQSLVEFTLVSIILIMILAGIFDLGRAYFVKIAVTDAAGEGALYASMNPGCLTSATCADPNNVYYRVQHASESVLVDWQETSVEITTPPVMQGGEHVTVTVSYNFEIMTPFISSFIGDILVIRATASQQLQ